MKKQKFQSYSPQVTRLTRKVQLGARTEAKEAAAFSTKKTMDIVVTMVKFSEEEKVRHPSTNPASQLNFSG